MDLGYGPLRVPELRWLCSQRGLTPYGRKRELLARLEEQDSAEPTAQQLAECHAPGLEPFRELETLAENLLNDNDNVGAVGVRNDGGNNGGNNDTAEAKSLVAFPSLPSPASVAPAQAKSQAVVPFVAPAQAKVPPIPRIPRPEGVGLSSDERALRSLLEFFACADVERKGQDTVLNCKYREFLGGIENLPASTFRHSAFIFWFLFISDFDSMCTSRMNSLTHMFLASSADQLRFIHSVFMVLQPDLLSGANGSSATAAAAAAAAAACTTDTLLRSAAQQEVPGGTNSKETWSTEMWKKCVDLIENHFSVCHLQVKHNSLCEELEALNKAALEKSEQIREVGMELDKLVAKEAQQRQQLLGRARLQLSAWVEKAEDEAAN